VLPRSLDHPLECSTVFAKVEQHVARCVSALLLDDGQVLTDNVARSANEMVRPCSWPLSAPRLAGGTKRNEHAMSGKHNSVIAAIGIEIGKNSFHVVGLDGRTAIALRQKWSRGQVEARLANIPACLIGMEACVGAHHLSRRLRLLGQMPG